MRLQQDLIDRANQFRERVDQFCSKLHPETSSDEYAIGWLGDEFTSPLDQLIKTETHNKPISVQEPILLVTPGTGKTTGIVALFWAYIVAEQPVVVGVSVRDSWLRTFITEYFDESEVKISPTLGSLSENQFMGTIQSFGTVIVYGSSDTVQRFRSNTLPATRFVGYGSRFSIGLHIGKITDWYLDEYFDDLTLYDGLGCLNTSVLYVEDFTNENRHQLESLSERLELHYQDNADAQHFHKVFSQGLFVGGYQRIGNLFGLRHVREETSGFALPVGHGTLWVVDLGGDLSEMARDLKGYRQYLSSATLNLIVTDNHHLQALVATGIQRVVFPGEAQNPSLSWSHDGTGNLTPFVTLLDV